jgi:hypothetical protein
MNPVIFLIITSLIYQAQAGGPVVSSTSSSPPESTAAPSCVLCADMLRNDVPPSPPNCISGSSQRATVTITYKPESGRSPASGVCAEYNTRVSTTEFGPLFKRFDASPFLIIIIDGVNTGLFDYEV